MFNLRKKKNFGIVSINRKKSSGFVKSFVIKINCESDTNAIIKYLISKDVLTINISPNKSIAFQTNKKVNYGIELEKIL